jgi:hypothetical protein
LDNTPSSAPDESGLLPPHTRIAIPETGNDYRIVEIGEGAFGDFTPMAVDLLADELQERGAVVPVIALREILDNLVHAVPCSASVVIDPSCKGLVISDTGPGIPRPDLAFELGYSTATTLQRTVIRGVGIGLYLAREDVRSCGGELRIDSSLGGGTHAHISLAGSGDLQQWEEGGDAFCLTQRQNNVLFLLSEGESLGPSGVAAELNVGVSTAHRDLVRLQEMGFVYMTPNGKRFLSEAGRSYLQSLLSL